MRIAFFVAMILTGCIFAAGSASAQSEGRIFMHNSSTGDHEVGIINDTGSYTSLSRDNYGKNVRYFDATVNGIVGTEVNTYGTFIKLLKLSPNPSDPFAWLPGVAINFTTIVGVGGALLAYDGGGGGYLYHLNGSRTMVRDWTTNSFSYWTDIIPTSNYFFFYNAFSGLYALLTPYQVPFPGDGYAVAQTTYGTIGKNYALHASRDAWIFLLNPTTGAYEIGTLPPPVTLTEKYIRRDAGTLPAGFDLIASMKDKILLYDRKSGNTLIGRIGHTPTKVVAWTQLASFKMAPGWARVVSSGEYLVFYNPDTTDLLVGYLNSASVFTKTFAQKTGKTYTHMFASKR